MNEQESKPQGSQEPLRSIKEPPSVAGLIRQLSNEISTLFSKEVELAKSEVSESIDDAKSGAIGMASGGAVLYAGILFLLLAGTTGLATVMAFWVAALIVGAVVTIIGAVMVLSGRKKVKPSSFIPERTIHSMHKDRHSAKGEVS